MVPPLLKSQGRLGPGEFPPKPAPEGGHRPLERIWDASHISKQSQRPEEGRVGGGQALGAARPPPSLDSEHEWALEGA